MVTIRIDAMNLLEHLPEDKRYSIIQIMQRVNGLYGTDSQMARNQAFEKLESLRREAPELDYDKELESYREEKYGSAN